jgi:hypothetical protein
MQSVQKLERRLEATIRIATPLRSWRSSARRLRNYVTRLRGDSLKCDSIMPNLYSSRKCIGGVKNAAVCERAALGILRMQD